MEEELREFLEELASREKSPATIAKYAHDVRLFFAWRREPYEAITKQQVIAYKQWLVEQYAPGGSLEDVYLHVFGEEGGA